MKNNQELILLQDLGMMYPTSVSKRKARYGFYKCYCGVEFKAQVQNVKNKQIKSCGCYQKRRVKETHTTHGLENHMLYQTWHNMVDRCTNPNNKKYKDYGGRGINVSDKWLNVENFINDMYPSYSYGLTIDRINNNGNYEKDNCRWTTKSVQSRNTRLFRTTNKSGYKGVSFEKNRNKFKAQICVNLKKIHLGLFETAIDGAKAYDKYVIDNNLEHTKNFS